MKRCAEAEFEQDKEWYPNKTQHYTFLSFVAHADHEPRGPPEHCCHPPSQDVDGEDVELFTEADYLDYGDACFATHVSSDMM